MSRLKDLVDELCPNGVEYSSIGSLITRVRTRGKDNDDTQQVYVVSNTLGMVKAEDFRENTIHSEDTSNYTVIKPNMYAYNPSRLNIGSIAMLKDNTPGLVSPMYVVFSIDEQKITKEFFEYNIKSSFVRNKIESFKEEGARFRFDFNRWDWIQIAVPPLPVQQEIIRMLDNFTGLTAELTAELTARKKQYEYYKKKLLTFDDSVPRIPLGDISIVQSGGTPLKAKCEYWDNGTIKWLGSTVCQNQKTVAEATNYISEIGLKNSSAKLMKKETTLIALVGATIGKIAFLPYEATINQNIAGVYPIDVSKLSPSFVFYACGMLYDNFIGLSQGKLAMANLSFVRGLKIPVPSLEEQELIVTILDRFDTLCNDITTGLPAEIEARKKQYDYYRDKLLTFPEVTS